MMRDLFQVRIETPRGVFAVIFHAAGIYRICFPGTAPPEPCREGRPPWLDLAGDFERYFRGERVEWERYPVDLESYPPFQRRVLEAVRAIPFGAVCTYREAAARAGSLRAWRAAGQALKANRTPVLVPCHRVISAAGAPGGWSGAPGWKEYLLKLEGWSGS